MLARGCAVNGANVILIDINEDSLIRVQKELDGLSKNSTIFEVYGSRSKFVVLLMLMLEKVYAATCLPKLE
jgi:hypothetical protein